MRCRSASRRGVILLVVISLLMLFAVAGIAFVVYSEAAATTARIWRDSESARRPDMDPELLMAYALGQLIYGTDNPQSALRADPNRANDLASNMYGQPGGVLAFNGTRNPSYTYPDDKHSYLAAVRPSDGMVLVPSYQRQAWGVPSFRAALPAGPEDQAGDVKNLAGSPGTLQPRGYNDSIWMDLGHPVMKAPDGRKFKPLFAPLIVDLDNRVNVNVHGNIMGSTDGMQAGGVYPHQGKSLSHQGLGPWEVNPERVLAAPDTALPPVPGGPHAEARRLFIGSPQAGVAGRYSIAPNADNPDAVAPQWAKYVYQPVVPTGQWGMFIHQLPENFTIKGPQYSPIDGDANFPRMGTTMPGFGMPAALPTGAFPQYSSDYEGWASNKATRNHALLYNFFNPQNSYYNSATKGRYFQASNMEALLRYGDKGSPALGSELFALCPLSFGDLANGGRARRQITTHAFDLDQSAVTPYAAGMGAAPYQWPMTPPISPFPLGAGPSGGVGTGLGRINLNRDMPRGTLPWYYGVTGADNTTFPTLPPKVDADGRIVNPLDYIRATEARQAFAKELFDRARLVTGAGDPNLAAPGSPELDALRWLAQLSANMVDFIDTDDCMTVFRWKGDPTAPKADDYVFGCELPRLVLNEVYAEASKDTTGTSHHVNFWIELLNPLPKAELITPPATAPLHLATREDNNARLQVPAGAGGKPAYPVYKIVITTSSAKLNDRSNVRGDPDKTLTPPSKSSPVKLELTDWSPEPTDPMTMKPPQPKPGVDVNIVRPNGNKPMGTPGDNDGYYLVGPKADFPGMGGPQPTLQVKEAPASAPAPRSALSYRLPNALIAGGKAPPNHTILLRRLACPGLEPNDDPADTSKPFNPYVTVDYIEDVKTTDAITDQGHMATPMDERYSVGRNQPYAAHSSQVKDQKPTTPLMGQPQHTFFQVNEQGLPPGQQRFPFDWLCFCDRPLISPVELLQVAGCRPHELTQKFMQGTATDPVTGMPNGKPQNRFGHLACGAALPGVPETGVPAAWFSDDARLYRLFEFMSASVPMQWVPIGGRTIGKININTIWDDPNDPNGSDVFNALGDANATNFFSQADVTSFFKKMAARRTANATGVPGPGDRPFRGFATPNAPLGDAQYPNGLGIDDTFFQSDPADGSVDAMGNRLPPAQRRRLFEPVVPNPDTNRHPYFRYEFMNKVFNNVTTRSNVFAVWLTVGFFECDDNNPPTLGAELGRSEGRHVRHRMFAIIDRTNLSSPVSAAVIDPATGQISAVNPGLAGPTPFFIPALSAVTGAAKIELIDVPDISGIYEGVKWGPIRPGDVLVCDTGADMEVVTVIDARPFNPMVDPPTNKGPFVIQAKFAKPHQVRFSITNAVLSHPGPQPRFDPRNPRYQGVVRFFSIIE